MRRGGRPHSIEHRWGDPIDIIVVLQRAAHGWQCGRITGTSLNPHIFGEAGHHLIHENLLGPMTAPRTCVEVFRANQLSEIYIHTYVDG